MPWRRERLPTPVFWPREFHGLYSPWGHKDSDTTERLSLSLFTFPGGSDSKEFACNAGDPGSISGLGRSPGKGNGNPLQYFCLENPMDRGAWRATVHRVAKSQTQLSDFTFTFHTGLLKRGSCSPLPTQGCLNEQNGMHWLGSLYLY